MYTGWRRPNMRQKEELDGVRVDVYRNLHDECMSVMSREPSSEDYGNVIGHVQSITISDASFVVRETGRLRVLEEETKNVHAVVRGVVDLEQSVSDNPIVITYNPYKYENFVTVEGERAVEEASTAVVSVEQGVVAEEVKVG